MSLIPEPGRQAAHILLDMVSAFDEDNPEPATNAAALNLAFERLNDVKAVTATFDDETDELDLDASGLIGGAVVTINWLVARIATDSLSKHDVIVKAREFIDAEG